MRTGITIAIILGILLFGLVLRGCGFAGGWLDDAQKTAHKEYDASAMLKKYEWFKDQSQRIQKMDQDIFNTAKLRDGVREQFELDNGKDHTKWDPITKKQYQDKVNLSDEMYLSTVAQRNSIVAEYNSQSSKFNWSPFKSKMDLPPTTFDEIK
jgi:hypothetical protein